MRVVSLHADVLVATSAIWQTNCTIVRGPVGGAPESAGNPVVVRIAGEDAGPGEVAAQARGAGETFVIDSPVLPEELDALPALLAQSGFPSPNGLLGTHGDWDHLLGRLAFPGVALGCSESTVARLAGAPGAVQRELRAFDSRFYIQRLRPLALGQIQSLPVPGRCGIGEFELELHPADGHTEDGMAVWIPWARVLIAGDYLSTVEPPEIGERSSIGAYRATLERLRPLVAVSEHVVPGHGPILDAERALGLLEENLASLTRAT